MSAGSVGDRYGTVWLVHVWVARKHWDITTGPWHWWNVYVDEATARAQAARRAAYPGWKGLSRTHVQSIKGEEQ